MFFFQFLCLVSSDVSYCLAKELSEKITQTLLLKEDPNYKHPVYCPRKPTFLPQGTGRLQPQIQVDPVECDSMLDEFVEEFIPDFDWKTIPYIDALNPSDLCVHKILVKSFMMQLATMTITVDDGE